MWIFISRHRIRDSEERERREERRRRVWVRWAPSKTRIDKPAAPKLFHTSRDNMKCLYTPEAKPTTKSTTTTTMNGNNKSNQILLVINFHQRLRKGWNRRRREEAEERVYGSSSSKQQFFHFIHYKYVLFTIWQVGWLYEYKLDSRQGGGSFYRSFWRDYNVMEWNRIAERPSNCCWKSIKQ